MTRTLDETLASLPVLEQAQNQGRRAELIINMDLRHTIQSDFLTARKARDEIRSNLLGTVLGELQKLEKNRPGKPPVDEDVIRILRGFVVSNEEILRFSSANDKAIIENEILNSYLPIMLDETTLKQKIEYYIAQGASNIGSVINELKNHHAGQFDGKMASEIIKKLLSK